MSEIQIDIVAENAVDLANLLTIDYGEEVMDVASDNIGHPRGFDHPIHIEGTLEVNRVDG